MKSGLNDYPSFIRAWCVLCPTTEAWPEDLTGSSAESTLMKVRKMCILKIGQKTRSETSHVPGQAWGIDMAPAECGKQPSHNSLSHCPRHGLGLGKVHPSAAHLGAGVGCGLNRTASVLASEVTAEQAPTWPQGLICHSLSNRIELRCHPPAIRLRLTFSFCDYFKGRLVHISLCRPLKRKALWWMVTNLSPSPLRSPFQTIRYRGITWGPH